jgi:hypothetical protein
VAGVDRLLAKSFETIIRENLGYKTVQKIENRLFEKYGISLTQSMEQFHKLDVVLREFFGAGADGLEQRFMRSVCNVKVVNGNKQILIENPILTKTILESFGDDDKKNILAVLGQPLIISQIIEQCKIPQTSGYRKVNTLIDGGFLIPSGHVTTSDGKKIMKYRSIFDKIEINIIKNKVAITLHLKTEDFETSSILTVCSQLK